MQSQAAYDLLEKSLSLLASRLMSSLDKSPAEINELVSGFRAWAEEASIACGAWSRETLALAKKIKTGLESGRPTETVLERLSQAMTEASQNLELETTGTLEAEEKTAPKETVAENTKKVTEEDLSSFQDFIAEAPEHLESVERNLLSLSRGENWDVQAVYRAFHTLKGISGFMGLNQLATLTHKAEALLEPFKNGGQPGEGQVDWLLLVCDTVRAQVQSIQEGLGAGSFRLVAVEGLMDSAEDSAVPEAAKAVELITPGKSQGSMGGAQDHSIRISVEKMDALLEAVSELAICQSQVSDGVENLGVTGHLLSESSRMGKISRTLQDIVLSLRMVPVHPLFLRMSLLARDLSRKTGKPLQLDLEGGETEVDRSMVESLTEPLVHLIRNAVDHGLEEAGERAQAGKGAEGLLKLSAYHQGGDFVLELSDNGRGVNYAKLEKKARELGLLSGDEIPSKEKLSEFLFHSGFSTAEKVTEVSGRGVGLDAVKRKIQSLKGSVHVESQEGKGTTFRLRIPLTLALMDAILVRVGNSRYVLPAYQVEGFMGLEGTQEHSVGSGRKWLNTRQGHLPLIDLEEGFGSRREGKLPPVVVQVEAAGRKACLMVDEVLGKQQVVIKELGEGLRDLKGVTGGAILGDGRVGLILDMEALMGLLSRSSSHN